MLIFELITSVILCRKSLITNHFYLHLTRGLLTELNEVNNA